MVLHELKIAWFSLSLIGLVGCWATFVTFGRTVGVYWGPVVYCIGCTILQISFCLGVIWKMNPLIMPRIFCIAQPIFMGFATFLMTGVAMAFSIATFITASKPKTWRGGEKVALAWRWSYVFPLAIYPLLASMVQITLVLRYDTGKRSQNLFCDHTDPLWLRLSGYAGVPPALYLPSFIFSVISVIRISQTNQHLKRSRDPGLDSLPFTELTPRKKRVQFRRSRYLPATPSKTVQSASIEPLTRSPSLFDASMSLPHEDLLGQQVTFSPPVELQEFSVHQHPELEPDVVQLSPTSSTFSIPKFANPTSSVHTERRTTSSDTRFGSDVTTKDESKDDWRNMLGPACAEHSVSSPVKWDEEGLDLHVEYGEKDDESMESYFGAQNRRSVNPRSVGVFKSRRPLPTLSPSVSQLITFQCIFIVIPLLGFFSTLFDTIRGYHSSLVLGTQHVALLLCAWIPVFIFGVIPIAKRRITFFAF